MNAPWNSDFHTNINLQMNYWVPEICNLAECHIPLFDYMDTLVGPGGRTAKCHYGAKGWVVHHLSDVWGFTTPADGIWGIWPVGAAWLCEHVWEHYLFGGDKDFLIEQATQMCRLKRNNQSRLSRLKRTPGKRTPYPSQTKSTHIGKRP